MARDDNQDHAAKPKGSGWLSKLRPGVRKAEAPRPVETPDDLWIKCPDTGELIYKADLEAAKWVTPSGFHMRIGPEQRFRYTFDEGQVERIAAQTASDDPLGFTDQKPYVERLAAARKSTGENDAMAIGYGRIRDVAAGEGFIGAAREAVKRQTPLVVFTASGGARMQEGTLSLMQMARTTLAVEEVKRAGLPYLVVLTDPTTGGVTASYAMLGDVQFVEPGALVGFTGPRIIEQTIRETLPPGFQRAEFLEDKGIVDAVVERKDLPDRLGSVLRVLMAGRASKRAA
jgi:acetyl-CoA carboxylase carboxyl transferase subunit beta